MKVLLSLILILSAQSLAAKPRNGQSERSKKNSSREVNFDELLVQGKHHFSDEAVITVEQDKVLDALLEVRKDFKDRMKKSAKRN